MITICDVGPRDGLQNEKDVVPPETRAELVAAQPRVRDAGLDLYAWVRVGRDPAAADAHPEWLHVPQHDEWLDGKQGKHGVYPWVCVNNREVFAHEKERLASLLQGVRGLAGVFVSDIQGPPAGCGCVGT